MKKENKTIWFRNKTYGWGWYPSSWEGWAVTFAYILLAVGGSLFFVKDGKAEAEYFWWYLPFLFALTIALLGICWKTGEKPEWRWGGKPMFKKK